MLSAPQDAKDLSSGTNYISAATYGPDMSLVGFLSGSGGAATITNSFSYNKRLQPVSMSASTPGATVFSIGYDFHFGNGDNGDVYGITNYKDQNRNQTFTYDALNRLITAQNTGTDCSKKTLNPNQTEYWGNSYSYDAWGNLTHKVVTKCSAEGLNGTALVNNQLSGYDYDAAGNMTNDGSFAYSFDPENRLIGANGYTYMYDGDGNRVGKTNGTTGTLYWYTTPGVVAETDLSGNNPHQYVFFNGERVARIDSNGLVYYYFSDHLKTASVVTDSSGNIRAESDYYPWGGELQLVANDSNHYKFTGKERDSETELDYFGARYYSNALSRFMTPDWSATPVTVPYADLGDPQTLNQYSYVRNLPTTNIDRDGHGIWNQIRCAFGSVKACKAQADEEEAAYEAEIKRERDYLIKQQVEINGKRKDYSKASDDEVKKDFQIVVDAFNNKTVQQHDSNTPSIPGGPKPTSPNQMQKQVENGQAPKSVDRVDSPRFPHEKPHVEFNDGNALNNDGTWKHGGRELTNVEKDWLLTNGWQLPK